MAQDKTKEYIRFTIGWTFFIVLSTVLLWYASQIFLLLFGSILLAIFLNLLSLPLQNHFSFRQSSSIFITLAIVFIFIGFSSWFIAPIISEQVNRLINILPEAWNQATSYWNNFPFLKEQLDREKIYSYARALFSKAGPLFSTTIGILTSAVILIAIGIYLSVNPMVYRKHFLNIMPKKKQKLNQRILDEMHSTLKLWLAGKFCSMTLVGISTTIGLWLLGIPLPLILGVIAALFTFVPNFGPALACIPAILLAASLSLWKALYVILLYIALQTVESYLINPLIQKRTVMIPPAAVIFFQVLLGYIAGIPGILFATPLLAASIVLFKNIYKRESVPD